MISSLALLFALLIALEIGIQEWVLMPSFAELERDDAVTSMKRAGNALDASLDGLALTAADWGNWADAYEFAQTRSAGFIQANITPVAMKQVQLDALVIVDTAGDVILSHARDLETGAGLDIGFPPGTALPRNFPWRCHRAAGPCGEGLLQTPRGILMAAAAPILDGSGKGLPRGMVIVGRLMTPHRIRQLGAQAQVDLTMTSHRSSTAGDRLVESGAVTRVVRPFFDIYGRPLMSLRVEVPRRITGRGRSAVVYASALLVMAGISALILLVVVLNRIVLAPLARVTRHAVSIGGGADLTARLDLPIHDEVGVLAREFDRMVERLAASRRQLVDQSFHAGFAELAKGVLHNLGNAMTPLGVRLAKLGERLREAPVADVEFAVTELAQESPGSPRHADLEQFLQLGCRQLAAVMKEAQSDVVVIQRQSTVVQTALVELMRSTRNEPVVEAVRLPSSCPSPSRSSPTPPVGGWWSNPTSRCGSWGSCRWRAPCCGSFCRTSSSMRRMRCGRRDATRAC